MQNDLLRQSLASMGASTARQTRALNDALNAQAARQAAQTPQDNNPILSFFTGIGDSINNAGKSLVDFFGRETARVGNLIQGKSLQEAENEAQAFSNWVYGTDNRKDADAKRLGAALDMAGNVATFVPGGGAAARIAKGAIGGALGGSGREFTENAGNADIGRAVGRGLTGAAASGLTAGAMGLADKGISRMVDGGGALTQMAGRGLQRVTNPATIVGNVGRGALGGATSGAVSGFGGTLAAGGDLGEALNAAGQGAWSGAQTGAVSGGINALGSRAIQRMKPTIDRARNAIADWGDSPRDRRASLSSETDGTSVSGSQASSIDVPDNEQNINIPRTSKQVMAQKRAVREVTDQFGTVPKAISDRTKPVDTFTSVAKDMGLIDEGDIRLGTERAVETGSQIIRDAAGSAGVIDTAETQRLVKNLSPKAAKNVQAIIDDIIERSPSTVVGGKNGMDALTLQREIERIASDAQVKGNVSTSSGAAIDRIDAKNLFKAADAIRDQLDTSIAHNRNIGAAFDRNAAAIDNLRATFPDNPQFQRYVDRMIDTMDSATPLSSLRTTIKVPTRAQIYIDAADQNFSTFGGRVPANQIPTTEGGMKSRGINMLADKVRNSRPVREQIIRQNLAIAEGGTSAAAPSAPRAPRTPVNIPDVVTTLQNRSVGLSEAQNAVARQVDRQNAPIDHEMANLIYEYLAGGGNMNNVQIPDSVSDQGVNRLANALNANMANFGGEPMSAPAAPNAGSLNTALGGGQEMTIGGATQSQVQDAMIRALQDGNFTAFNAYSKMNDYFDSSNQPAATTVKNLTGTQQRANAAATALQEISGLQPDMGFNLSNIPVIGGLATMGGNQYEAAATSLAQQIGYMVSGANITPSEAERIGNSYVPQPWDSEETRRQKLQRAQTIIGQYQQGTYEAGV